MNITSVALREEVVGVSNRIIAFALSFDDFMKFITMREARDGSQISHHVKVEQSRGPDDYLSHLSLADLLPEMTLVDVFEDRSARQFVVVMSHPELPENYPGAPPVRVNLSVIHHLHALEHAAL